MATEAECRPWKQSLIEAGLSVIEDLKNLNSAYGPGIGPNEPYHNMPLRHPIGLRKRWIIDWMVEIGVLDRKDRTSSFRIVISDDEAIKHRMKTAHQQLATTNSMELSEINTFITSWFGGDKNREISFRGLCTKMKDHRVGPNWQREAKTLMYLETLEEQGLIQIRSITFPPRAGYDRPYTVWSVRLHDDSRGVDQDLADTATLWTQIEDDILDGITSEWKQRLVKAAWFIVRDLKSGKSSQNLSTDTMQQIRDSGLMATIILEWLDESGITRKESTPQMPSFWTAPSKPLTKSPKKKKREKPVRFWRHKLVIFDDAIILEKLKKSKCTNSKYARFAFGGSGASTDMDKDKEELLVQLTEMNVVKSVIRWMVKQNEKEIKQIKRKRKEKEKKDKAEYGPNAQLPQQHAIENPNPIPMTVRMTMGAALMILEQLEVNEYIEMSIEKQFNDSQEDEPRYKLTARLTSKAVKEMWKNGVYVKESGDLSEENTNKDKRKSTGDKKEMKEKRKSEIGRWLWHTDGTTEKLKVKANQKKTKAQARKLKGKLKKMRKKGKSGVKKA